MLNLMKTAAVAACVLILAFGIYLGGCDTLSVKPIEPGETPEYYAYFSDMQTRNNYFRYNTSTMEIDTFYLPYDSYYDGFGISPDGKTMYLHPDDAIVEVSLDSFVVVAEHPIDLPKGNVTMHGHEVIVSPDNRYLAVINWNLYIIDLADYSIVYSDTSTYFERGWFSNDSKSFFCAAQGEDRNEVLEIVFNDGLLVNQYQFDGGSVHHIIAFPDNDLWFLLLYPGYGIDNFQVYDRAADSIIFGRAMCPGGGYLEITPNGQYVIYSHPGSAFGYCPPYEYITIFNVAGNTIDREVATWSDSLGVGSSIGELWITPDGRHLVGISRATSGAGHVFHYNLRSNQVEARFWGPGRNLFSLGGQRNR